MNQSQQYEIKIKKGDHIFTIKRNKLITCNETPDGISFQFRDGIHLLYEDHNLPTHAKMKIKLTIDQLINGNIEINLNDYNNPISLKI